MVTFIDVLQMFIYNFSPPSYFVFHPSHSKEMRKELIKDMKKLINFRDIKAVG